MAAKSSQGGANLQIAPAAEWGLPLLARLQVAARILAQWRFKARRPWLCFMPSLGKDIELPARNHIVDVPFDATSVSVARTGYTGEDGIEVFFSVNNAAKFWNAVLEQISSLELSLAAWARAIR